MKRFNRLALVFAGVAIVALTLPVVRNAIIYRSAVNTKATKTVTDSSPSALGYPGVTARMSITYAPLLRPGDGMEVTAGIRFVHVGGKSNERDFGNNVNIHCDLFAPDAQSVKMNELLTYRTSERLLQVVGWHCHWLVVPQHVGHGVFAIKAVLTPSNPSSSQNHGVGAALKPISVIDSVQFDVEEPPLALDKIASYTGFIAAIASIISVGASTRRESAK